MKTFSNGLILGMLLIVPFCVPPQDPGLTPVIEQPAIVNTVSQSVRVFDEPFSVSSVKERDLYRGESVELIVANGVTYLAASGQLEKVPAVELSVSGNAADWVVVWKAKSGDKPRKLRQYQPGRFIFEHSGPGLYYLQTQNAKGEPEFAEFTVGNVSQPEPQPEEPAEPSPAPLPIDLSVVFGKTPADSATAKALAAAYRSAISEGKDKPLDAVKDITTQKRRDALRSLPSLSTNWNAWLLELSDALSKIEKPTDYLAALATVATHLEQNASRPAAVIYYSQTPPGCPPGVNCQLPTRNAR